MSEHYQPIDSKYLVSIIEADGRNDLESGRHYGNDLFSSDVKVVLNQTTSPNAKWYNGAYSGLQIYDISDNVTRMTFKKGTNTKTGWFATNTKRYYLINTNGDKAKGFKTINSNKYYFDATTGVMQTGWQTINNNKYYFDKSSGVMKTGWNTIDNKNCYFDNNGIYHESIDDLEIVGSYKTFKPSQYGYLETYNQATVGDPVTVTVRPKGGDGNFTYSYSISCRAVQGPDEKRGPYTGNTTNSVGMELKNAGLTAISVKVTDKSNHSISKTVYLMVNPELKITSFTGDHAYNGGEVQGKAPVADTIKFNASVSGGFYQGRRYTYEIIKRNATSPNDDKTYSNLTSPAFSWKPDSSGIYAIRITATDPLRNRDVKTLYYQITN